MPPVWLTLGYLNAALTLIVKAAEAFRGLHSMNFLDLARAIFGLAFTLGLIGLAAWAARRYAPALMARLNAERGERRMTVVETLVLDPARRLVLVKIDEEERLILLGEGRELIEPRGDGK
jgi:flagellar protein FliO/FliZ